MPRCAVIIPTFNGAVLLKACLDALLALPASRTEEHVVVVDDASTDSTQAVLRAYRDEVTVVTHEENAGFAVSCNDGAAAGADCDYLVFLNNDTLPLAGWLDALVEEAEEHAEADIVGARLLFPNGTIQHAGVAIGQDRRPHHLYTGFPGEHPAVTRSREVVAVTAACMLVRRTAFARLGGFDVAFHNGYEDVDFCLRLREQDRGIRYCPRSVVVHLESTTRWPTGVPESTEPNERLYEERWLDRVVPDDFDHYVADRLIRVEYGPYFPLRMTVSPLLATVSARDDDGLTLERLLTIRSSQVMESMAGDTRKHLAQLVRPRPRLANRSGLSTTLPHEVVRRGGTRPLADGARRLVSLVLPLRNDAADVRELLRAVQGQDAVAAVEIIAVDSGSGDDTLQVLKEHDATVIAIDPADFDHGLARALGASYAGGDALLFTNARARPSDRRWLAPLLAALEGDPSVAGACSCVAPRPDASVPSRRDIMLDPSGSSERKVTRIDDWDAYRSLTVEERRVFLNFHTVSAVLRADVFERHPFRSVTTIGEDLQWAREVAEAGYALVHEPASVVVHSHEYSLVELFMRNVDDGIANRDIVGRDLTLEDARHIVEVLTLGDWEALGAQNGGDADPEAAARLRVEFALRRAAQLAGQWVGVRHEELPEELVATFSRLVAMRNAHTVRSLLDLR